MAGSETWAGWVRFAGILMLIIAMIDVFQGLIAIIRSEYYVLSPNQIIVFDTTTWGWITLIWGIVVACAGFGLLSGATWARWFTIVVGSLNFFVQLGFVGNSQYHAVGADGARADHHRPLRRDRSVGRGERNDQEHGREPILRSAVVGAAGARFYASS